MMSIDDADASVEAALIETYAKKVIRDMYHDIPSLRPALLELSTRRLVIRRLARALSPDSMPSALAEATAEARQRYEASIPKASTGKEIIVSSFNQRGKLLAAYGSATAQAQGWTDEEAARVAGLPERSCWWKRAGELREGGFIEVMRDSTDTPVRRKGQAGVERQVCVITDQGLRTLASLET